MRHALLPIAILMATSCALPLLDGRYRPQVTVVSELGTVRAYDRETASGVAKCLSLAPHIKDMLGSRRDDPIEVWVLQSARVPGGYLGCTRPNRIEMGRDSLAAPHSTMAHELTHWYAEESPFAGLPRVVEEGLAHWVKLEFTGGPGLRDMWNERVQHTAIPSDDVQVDDGTWLDLDHERLAELTLFGYRIVEQIGLSRMREMAAANAGPLDYLAEYELLVASAKAAAEKSATRVSFTAEDGSVLDTSAVEVGPDGAISGRVPPGASSITIQAADGRD